MQIRRTKQKEYIEINDITFKGKYCLKIQTYEDNCNWGNVLGVDDWCELFKITKSAFFKLCKKHQYELDCIYHVIPLFKTRKQAEEMIDDLIPYIVALNLIGE